MGHAKRFIPRAAAALVIIVVAALSVASPAQAHPEVYGPSCFSEDGYIECTLAISGAAPPVIIRWSFKGVYHSECDDQTYCAANCRNNSWLSVDTVVTDASNVPVVNAPTWYCYGGESG